MAHLFGLGAFLACLGGAPGAWAAAIPPGPNDQVPLSPYWDWKTIETENFRLTFPAELEEIAQRAANYYEEAQATMGPALYWKPHYKVQVLLVDSQDSANGFTTPIARMGMVLLVTPPDNWFSTGDYDDWLRLLVFHEYTHFLNMDATRDFYKPLRYLFGDVLLPNSFWPAWMLEGLAVYDETRYTRSGRGRSVYYDMVLRSAVESGVLDDSRFVTLDRVNGDDPWFPGGETVYLFGYQLMNRIAHEPVREDHLTADGGGPLRDGEDALGVMSWRSSGRIPYFINGNLENVIGKDWYRLWNEWVADTRKRMTADLATIRSKPVTHVETLTDRGFETLGSAVSPDGNWLAYTQDSSDRRQGLYLRNLKTGETRRLMDKLMGANVSFTPDSKTILYSALQRNSKYTLYSDLGAYDLEKDRSYDLTDGVRARDPDVSRDGKWVTFTRTVTTLTEVVVAPLELRDGKLALGEIRTAYRPAKYAAASTPRFSADGKKIYFSLHQNGMPSEELVEVDRDHPTQLRALVSNGHYNRYPVVAPNGDVYFICDATGVANLYRLGADGQPRMVTNVTTGVAFPSFGPNASDRFAYASYFSWTGWNLARVPLAEEPLDPKALRVSYPPAPPADEKSSPHEDVDAKHPVQDYSIYPSILPRYWFPFLVATDTSLYFGGGVAGFDATDRHRYFASFAYDTQTQKPDIDVAYSNRSLGPTFTFEGQGYTDTPPQPGAPVRYIRKERYDFSAAYSFPWTYSSLTPAVAVGAERRYQYDRFDVGDLITDQSPYVPTIDSVLVFTNAESSRLAISVEGGRTTQLGSRLYLESGQDVWKGLFSDTEYFRITDHSVLRPQLAASMSSSLNPNYVDSDVIVAGRNSDLIGSLPGVGFDKLGLRGYPGVAFLTKGAMVGSLDYRFPISWIYRGWGTNPVFVDNLWAFGFVESAYFPFHDTGTATAPSAGGGARLNTTFFLHIPITFSLEYHQGFREAVGGRGELFFQLGVAGIKY